MLCGHRWGLQVDFSGLYTKQNILLYLGTCDNKLRINIKRQPGMPHLSLAIDSSVTDTVDRIENSWGDKKPCKFVVALHCIYFVLSQCEDHVHCDLWWAECSPGSWEETVEVDLCANACMGVSRESPLQWSTLVFILPWRRLWLMASPRTFGCLAQRSCI